MAMPVETGLLVTGQVIMTVPGLGRTLAIGCVTAGGVGPALRPGTLAARPAAFFGLIRPMPEVVPRLTTCGKGSIGSPPSRLPR